MQEENIENSPELYLSFSFPAGGIPSCSRVYMEILMVDYDTHTCQKIRRKRG
ncbi:MAG: hypothetical protein K0S04_3981 [Herbinix sp.]|jgi:hypothetical protein|nr:hypothetical protein [Herbinix sp.]